MRVLLVTATLLAGLVAPARAVEFTYTIKEPGHVSAAIFDATGRQVRPLQYGVRQEPGTYRLAWDGLDRDGNPLPAGTYEWRLLRTPGFTREFLVNLGTNITWREHDYWVGNHYGPSCLMVDSDGAVYVGGVSSEGPPHLLKMSPDGRRLHWSTRLEDGLVGLARIGRVLYWLKGNALHIVRADSGGGFWGDPKLRYTMEQTTAPRGQFFDLKPKDGGKGGPTNLAGGPDYLAICYRDRDEVRLLWLADDAIVRDETAVVPKPLHAAAAADGTLYVLTATGIVALDPATKQTRVVVTDTKLDKPGKLAFDPACGDLLVTNGTEVRRYQAADGTLVASYGGPKGRTYGRFDPLEFDTLLSIAADGKGGFFTAELCPRRVAHFTGREKHVPVQQWFGGMGWEWQAIVDPEDPTVAFLPIDYKHIGRGKIDYATKSWTLTHLYDTPEEFSWGANATDQHRGPFPAIGNHTCWWSVRRHGGKTYLVNTVGTVMVMRVDDDRLVPVACAGSLHPSLDRQNPPAWWIAALKQKGIDAAGDEGRGTDNPRSFTAAGGYRHFAYTWADTNLNGRFDVEEVNLGSVGNRFNDTAQSFVDRDWNLHWASGEILPNAGGDDGFPVWNWDTAKRVAREMPAETGPRAVWADDDGSVYAVTKGADHAGQDFAPLTWPNNSVTVNRLAKWDREGQLLFAVGKHTTRKDFPPGQFADLRAFVGTVRGNLVVRDACSPGMVWTPDGLYAGKISRDDVPKWWLGPQEATRENPSLGPYSDDTWGTIVMETKTGDALWLANDTHNTMVIRVKGWDGWERQRGTLTLNTAAPVAKRQGDGLNAEYFTTESLDGEPAKRRLDPVIWFGKMRGDHHETRDVHPWVRKDDAVKLDPGGLSARWTGFLEAPVSEDFTFTLYTYGQGNAGAKVRLWVDGTLIADAWDGVEPKQVSGYVYTRAVTSRSIGLTAGTRVPIKVEYVAAGGADAHLHLFWESFSCDPRHVPTEALYQARE